MKSKIFNDTQHFPLVSRVYVFFRISKLPLVSNYCFQFGPNSSQSGLKNKRCWGHNSRWQQQQRIHVKLEFLSVQFIQTYLKLAEHSHTLLLWTPTSTYWRTMHMFIFFRQPKGFPCGPVGETVWWWGAARRRSKSGRIWGAQVEIFIANPAAVRLRLNS